MKICIVSYGGTATTYIGEVLEKNGIIINSPTDTFYGDNHDPRSIKHGNPYRDIYNKFDKIIYMIGRPDLALLSHYRRNWPKQQYEKIRYNLSHIMHKWEDKWYNLDKLISDSNKKKKDLYGLEMFYRTWLYYANDQKLISSNKVKFTDIEELGAMSKDELSLFFFDKLIDHNIVINNKSRNSTNDNRINGKLKDIYKDIYNEALTLIYKKIPKNPLCRYYTHINDLIFTTRYSPESQSHIQLEVTQEIESLNFRNVIPFYFTIFNLIIKKTIDKTGILISDFYGSDVNLDIIVNTPNTFDYVLCEPSFISHLLKITDKYISINGIEKFLKFKRTLVIGGEDQPHLSYIKENQYVLYNKIKTQFKRILFEGKDIIDDEIELMPCGLLEKYTRGLNLFDLVVSTPDKPNSLRVLMSFGKFWGPGIGYDSNFHQFWLSAREEREMLLDKKNNLELVDFKQLGRFEYWKELSTYGFFICPIGNGVLTPKIVEALCVNTIPICFNHHYHRELRDKLEFPIVIINSLDDITIKNLNKWYSQLYTKVLNFKYNISTAGIHKLIMMGRETYTSYNKLNASDTNIFKENNEILETYEFYKKLGNINICN